MANTNGGIICYGVCETDNKLKPIGMTQIDDITDMKKKLNKYLPYELITKYTLFHMMIMLNGKN